ncbi:MAG: sel1 repeat family protein, partial [Alphaproteobacteria bacterium]
YARGEGVPKKEIEALMWMMLAADRGHPAAIENAKILRGRLSAGQIAEAERAVAAWVPRSDR